MLLHSIVALGLQALNGSEGVQFVVPTGPCSCLAGSGSTGCGRTRRAGVRRARSGSGHRPAVQPSNYSGKWRPYRIQWDQQQWRHLRHRQRTGRPDASGIPAEGGLGHDAVSRHARRSGQHPVGSRPLGINNADDIVGFAIPPSDLQTPVEWPDSSTPTDQGELAGISTLADPRATAINDSNLIVGFGEGTQKDRGASTRSPSRTTRSPCCRSRPTVTVSPSRSTTPG
jgi:hypothetical protein